MRVLASVLLALLTTALMAQPDSKELDYRNALGIRASYSGLVNLSYKRQGKSDFEIFVGTKKYDVFLRDFELGLYFGKHYPIPSVEGLKWYTGTGISLTATTFDNSFGVDTGNAGLVGGAGLEYKIAKVPLAISIDWLPAYYFRFEEGFNATRGGIAARFAF